MKQVLCCSTHHMPHPSRTHTRSIKTIFALQALPLLSSTSIPGWAQDESYKHNFMSLFRSVSSPQVLLYLYDILRVNVKKSQSGMKKILAPLTACIWVWLIFFLKLFLVFQYGVQAHVPFSLNWSSHLRDSQWDHSGNISSWRSLLGDFFYLFCPVLGISYRCFSYFGWKGY